MSKVLMKGNEAMGTAAIKAGCTFFAGYPITPQNELPEFMSRELPLVGGSFIQAESEISAINMIYGAAGAGARAMTSSSSPGIALKQEGISYIAGAELPCVIINVMRGGPGLGGIQPSQADYFQSVKGGGNGDYYLPVYAPSTLQEAVDLIGNSFDVADRYRTPVLVVADGMIGQMMEPVDFSAFEKKELPKKDWSTDGTKGKREPNIINSLYIQPEELEEHCLKLQKKYDLITEKECKWEEVELDDAEVVFVAYGSTSRIVKNVVKDLRSRGIKAGLVRPITLWPFPKKVLRTLPDSVKNVICVEMSLGQMVDDVEIAVQGTKPVFFYGRTGGMIPTPKDIIAFTKKVMDGDVKCR